LRGEYEKTKIDRYTPLTHWLLDYVDVHNTNLSELALQAGLSAESLRSLITYPETCSDARNLPAAFDGHRKSVDELFQMAGWTGMNQWRI